MSTLGVGYNEAQIFDKSGTRFITKLDGVGDLRWTRALSSISEASVSVGVGGHAECCDMLGSLGTWGHSLVMFRNGIRCWEGPITSLRWGRGTVEIGAHDVLGWAMKKATAAREVFPETPAFVINEAQVDMGVLFGEHDPNVAAHIQYIGLGTGPTVSRDVKAFAGYYDDQLNELVKAGLQFTTIGRRIVFWPSTEIIGRLPTLLPTKHMSGDVDVSEDGLATTTRGIGVNDDGEVGIAPGSTGVDPFYGLLETLVPFEAPGADNLANIAEQSRQGAYPAPISVNVPQGSVLSCDAPYDIRELVAGSLMNVKIDDGLCKKVEATQQLSNVEVSQDSSGEKVAITVKPLAGEVE